LAAQIQQPFTGAIDPQIALPGGVRRVREGDGLARSIWQTAASKDSTAFARHRQEGEAQEFIKKDYAGAAASLLTVLR
jgi:hypothetical protein